MRAELNSRVATNDLSAVVNLSINVNKPFIRFVTAVAIVLTGAVVQAGMPSPQWIVTESGQARLHNISFFLLVLIGSSAGVWGLWNTLRRDFPRLPALRFRGAVAAVILLGLASFVVLTMISGARELMTPGAWERSGATYRLKEGTADANAAGSIKEESELQQLRRARIDVLRFHLWNAAARNDRRFPDSLAAAQVPAELRGVPTPPRMEYRYFGGRSLDEEESILLMEPAIYGPTRLALMTTGQIRAVSADQPGPPTASRRKSEPKPNPIDLEKDHEPAEAELPTEATR